MSIPKWADWKTLWAAVVADPKLNIIIKALEGGQSAPKHYSVVHGTLFYKGRVVIPKKLRNYFRNFMQLRLGSCWGFSYVQKACSKLILARHDEDDYGNGGGMRCLSAEQI